MDKLQFALIKNTYSAQPMHAYVLSFVYDLLRFSNCINAVGNKPWDRHKFVHHFLLSPFHRPNSNLLQFGLVLEFELVGDGGALALHLNL